MKVNIFFTKMISSESSTNWTMSKKFRVFFCGWLVMCRKSAAITQNGYITAECGIVGFVARNLLYKTLYVAFQTRWKNRAWNSTQDGGGIPKDAHDETCARACGWGCEVRLSVRMCRDGEGEGVVERVRFVSKPSSARPCASFVVRIFRIPFLKAHFHDRIFTYM